MSGYQLCQVRRAKHPYYIESISTNIYTIEELCFYLHQNIYLIDKTMINEALCDWIRDELGLTRLYRKLYEQLDKEESIGNFILPIFKEIGYLTLAEFRALQEKISQIEVQPEDIRRKMKADYLVNFQKYENAIHEYYQILKNRNPGNVGVQFYAGVLTNMASAYARMFLFREAADCLWQSYGIVRSNEVYRRYLATLPLFLSEEDYLKRLRQLRVPREQIEKIEAASREICQRVRSQKADLPFDENLGKKALRDWKREYLKGVGV